MGFSSIQKTASTGSSATGALVGANSLQPKQKTFGKVTADNFPQWVFSGAKVAELRHTQSQSGPDPARHPVVDVGYPGSPFRARMS